MAQLLAGGGATTTTVVTAGQQQQAGGVVLPARAPPVGAAAAAPGTGKAVGLSWVPVLLLPALALAKDAGIGSGSGPRDGPCGPLPRGIADARANRATIIVQ